MGLEDIEKKLYRNEDRAKLDAERTHETPYSIYGEKIPRNLRGINTSNKPIFRFSKSTKRRSFEGYSLLWASLYYWHSLEVFMNLINGDFLKSASILLLKERVRLMPEMKLNILSDIRIGTLLS